MVNVELPEPTPRWILAKIPVTVGVFVVVQGYIAANGIGMHDVFGRSTSQPFFTFFTTPYMFFHAGWFHYAANMELWIPFGILLTWFTSNRHLLFFALAVDFMTSIIALLIEGAGIGMSHVVFGVVAATLVQSIGLTLRNRSQEALQIGVTAVLTFGVVGFFIIAIFSGPGPIGYFAHLLGFLFGGAFESIYVFSAHRSS